MNAFSEIGSCRPVHKYAFHFLGRMRFLEECGTARDKYDTGLDLMLLSDCDKENAN